MISDDDRNTIIESASVTLLDNPDGDNERLFVTSNLPMNITFNGNHSQIKSLGVSFLYFIMFTETGNTYQFFGRGSINVYEQVLSSIAYLNTASEPTREPPRRVSIRVFDGLLYSNPIVGLININLTNDNPLLLSCGVGVSAFVEGSGDSVYPATQLSLVDLDADHVVSTASILIQNAEEGDSILINATLAGRLIVEQGVGATVNIAGEAMASQYQVS